MPTTLPEGQPQADQLSIELPDSGEVLDRFEGYSFDDDWTAPCSAFHFTIGGKENPGPHVMAALYPGAKVELKINGITQDAGYIDDVVPRASRGAGKRWTVTGRNALAPVLSSGADPFDQGLRFTATQSLDDLIKGVFGRYGFIAYAIDDAQDRAIKTGLANQRFSKKKGKLLKRYSYGQQLKPQAGEGAFQFVDKIVNRAGFYLRCSANGKTIVVTTPDYEQAPICRLVRHIGGNVSNILEGGIGCVTREQPSIIVATGFAGGGDWDHSSLKVAMVNELVGFDGSGFTSASYANGILGVLGENPDIKLIPARGPQFQQTLCRPLPRARGLFLHDQDARSIGQLENFVRLHMSDVQHRMWAGDYVVSGHTYFDGVSKIPWTVNTIADVDDQDSGPPGSDESFTSPMWIRGRTFEKTRNGTFTRVRVTLPYTMDLFPQDGTDDATPAKKKAPPAPDDAPINTVTLFELNDDGTVNAPHFRRPG
jgi:hypothetical protein